MALTFLSLTNDVITCNNMKKYQEISKMLNILSVFLTLLTSTKIYKIILCIFEKNSLIRDDNHISIMKIDNSYQCYDHHLDLKQVVDE